MAGAAKPAIVRFRRPLPMVYPNVYPSVCPMMLVDIQRRLLRWGNGFGIRLTTDEVRRLGLREGATVHADVKEARPRNDTAKATLFSFRAPYDIQAILEEEAARGARGNPA